MIQNAEKPRLQILIKCEIIINNQTFSLQMIDSLQHSFKGFNFIRIIIAVKNIIITCQMGTTDSKLAIPEKQRYNYQQQAYPSSNYTKMVQSSLNKLRVETDRMERFTTNFDQINHLKTDKERLETEIKILKLQCQKNKEQKNLLEKQLQQKKIDSEKSQQLQKLISLEQQFKELKTFMESQQITNPEKDSIVFQTQRLRKVCDKLEEEKRQDQRRITQLLQEKNAEQAKNQKLLSQNLSRKYMQQNDNKKYEDLKKIYDQNCLELQKLKLVQERCQQLESQCQNNRQLQREKNQFSQELTQLEQTFQQRQKEDLRKITSLQAQLLTSEGTKRQLSDDISRITQQLESQKEKRRVLEEKEAQLTKQIQEGQSATATETQRNQIQLLQLQQAKKQLESSLQDMITEKQRIERQKLRLQNELKVLIQQKTRLQGKNKQLQTDLELVKEEKKGLIQKLQVVQNEKKLAQKVFGEEKRGLHQQNLRMQRDYEEKIKQISNRLQMLEQEKKCVTQRLQRVCDEKKMTEDAYSEQIKKMFQENKYLQNELCQAQKQKQGLVQTLKSISSERTKIEEDFAEERRNLQRTNDILIQENQEIKLTVVEKNKQIQEQRKRLDPRLHALFANEIFEKDFEGKTRLITMIENYSKKKILSSRLLYRYDPLNPTNVHKYIDDKPGLLCVTMTKNAVVACFYPGALRDKVILNEGGLIMSVTNNKSYALAEKTNPNDKKINKGMVYDQYYVIFGNSEFRLKSGTNDVLSMFNKNASYYNNGGDKVSCILNEGDKNETTFELCEYYQVFFEENNN